MSDHHLHPFFSHIYVEDGARDYPDTSLILAKYPSSEIIPIQRYQEVFNRPRQNWEKQKQSRKLILAVRKDNFLYEGSSFAPNFNHQNFYYNSLILNCIYDCDYCFLQGMYPSANIVIFVNGDSYFEATTEQLKKTTPLYLCISYDTDLLAFSGIIPYPKRWIHFAREHQDLTIELRTKSSSYKFISDIQPSSNVILAWTLSPVEIADAYEKRTPSLKSRMETVKRALDDGWQVRLCFDPLLLVPQWQEIYDRFVDQVFKELAADKVREVSIGVFRMNSGYLKNIQNSRSDSPILFHPFEKKENTVTYSEAEQQELKDFVLKKVENHVSKERIFLT